MEITGKVRLDDMGFEDIDMFWASDGTYLSLSLPPLHFFRVFLPVTGHRAVSHIGVETDDDDADDDNASFNYDTSNSITGHFYGKSYILCVILIFAVEESLDSDDGELSADDNDRRECESY